VLDRLVFAVNLSQKSQMDSKEKYENTLPKIGNGLTRIRIKGSIGPQFEEKTSVKFNFDFGQVNADSQLSKLQDLVADRTVETQGLSLFVSFVAAPSKQKELVDSIQNIFEGKESNIISKRIAASINERVLSFKVLEVGSNKVVVQIKPGALSKDILKSQLTKYIQGFGVETAAANGNMGLTINVSSGFNFYDVLEEHKHNLPTLATFCKALSFELITTSLEGSKLNQQLWEILPLLDRLLPIEFLKLMKETDLDLSFRDIKEFPSEFQGLFQLITYFILPKFPQVPKSREETEEYIFFKKLVNLVEPQIDIFATLENVAAAQLLVRTPGWGTAFVTTHD